MSLKGKLEPGSTSWKTLLKPWQGLSKAICGSPLIHVQDRWRLRLDEGGAMCKAVQATRLSHSNAEISGGAEFLVEARKLEHQCPHALKVKYRGS